MLTILNVGACEMILKQIFGDNRIVAIAGKKNTGKTNNIVALIRDFRKENPDTPIYFYGFDDITRKYIKQFKNVFEVSQLEQLADKKDCLIILDEFQKLRLNDRRYRDLLNMFVDFIYHNNCWVILCSPNLREYNSIIGGKIEQWILKSLDISECINGSQLKDAALAYNGHYKVINSIQIPKNELLVINPHYEIVVVCDYIEDIDVKKNHVNIFETKIVGEKRSKELSKKGQKSGIIDDGKRELTFE